VLAFLGVGEMHRIGNFNSIISGSPSFIDYYIYFFTIVQHVLLIPLTAYMLSVYGVAKNVWVQMWCECFIILFISFVISPDTFNLNCVRHDCDIVAHTYAYTYDGLYFIKLIAFWLVTFSAFYGFLLVVLKKLSQKKGA
jgi:hypothetical protein